MWCGALCGTVAQQRFPNLVVRVVLTTISMAVGGAGGAHGAPQQVEPMARLIAGNPPTGGNPTGLRVVTTITKVVTTITKGVVTGTKN